MPILVINMGGEMIYILHQRLQAQNIPEDKARKVLEDVIRTMYTPVFLEELFKPQEMYSSSSTKQIFDKLAHSSIMRLNKQSMEKLYDLMTMGIKYQLLSCTCPQQYLQITLQHLDALSNIVQSETVQQLVQSAVSRCNNIYTQLSQANWISLQQTVLQFFQGRKVKVSLFLQQELQTMHGVLVLKNTGRLPFNSEPPGTIRYFEDTRVVNTTRFHTALDGLVESTSQVLDYTSQLGKNMFLRPESNSASSRSVPSSFRDAEEAFERYLRTTGGGLHLSTSPSVAMPKSAVGAVLDSKAAAKDGGAARDSAKAEWSMLADLLGVHHDSAPGSPVKSSGSKSDNFHVNLVESRAAGFKDDGGEGSKGGADNEGEDYFVITIDIDATLGAKTVEGYMRDLDLQESKAESKRASAAEDDDDLLALMDSAK